jgi:hypothetical protein
MTGLTNIPAGTDAIAEPEGGSDAADAEGGPDAAADAEALGGPGGSVTAAPEQAWVTTTMSSASDGKGDPARRIVNP